MMMTMAAELLAHHRRRRCHLARLPLVCWLGGHCTIVLSSCFQRPCLSVNHCFALFVVLFSLIAACIQSCRCIVLVQPAAACGMAWAVNKISMYSFGAHDSC
jgi:hypothetical protein